MWKDGKTFHIYYFRSRGSGKGKESEYENLESDVPDEEAPLNISRDSEQREIDEFEEEERRLLAEEEKVKVFIVMNNTSKPFYDFI